MPTTNVNASVTSAKSSPRTPLTRKTTAPSATPMQDRHDRRRRQRPQERHVEARRERGRRVHPGAEERAVPEGKVARVSGEDVPGGGEHDPVENEVQERLVEERQPEQGERCQHAAHDQHRGVDPRHWSFPGRTRSTMMSSENDTSGAHDGEVSAIVTDSLTPMTMPATRGPSGRPSPPIITAAKTTPIHA